MAALSVCICMTIDHYFFVRFNIRLFTQFGNAIQMNYRLIRTVFLFLEKLIHRYVSKFSLSQ
jgi:hypothetical protein